MQQLKSDIQFLKGVGPKRAELLSNELGIFTFEDLLYHYPFRYIDRTKFYKIKEINESLPNIQIKGVLSNFREKGGGRKKYLIAEFSDETGSIELIWFKGVKWIKQNLVSGKEYIIFGKPARYGKKINIAHPDIDDLKEDQKISSSLQAVYPSTEKLTKKNITSKVFRKLILNVFEQTGKAIPETLALYLTEKLKLLSLQEALINIHFPQDSEKLKRAIFRLKFEELFYIQLNIIKHKYRRKAVFKGYKFETVGNYFNRFYKEKLPFELTGAQKKVIKEIRRDLALCLECYHHDYIFLHIPVH